jgi:hypothetical protein
MSPIPEGGEVTYTWGRRGHLYLREEILSFDNSCII